MDFGSDDFRNVDSGGVYLHQGEKGCWSRAADDEMIRVEGADLHTHLGWLDHRMVFEHTPLKEVARTIERWYRIDMEFSDEDLGRKELTATFENDPLTEILQVIELALGLRYEIVDRTVRFYNYGYH